MNDLNAYVEQVGQNARKAAFDLGKLDGATKTAVLMKIAGALRENAAALIKANAKDLAEASTAGLAAPLVARLTLNQKRINAMAEGVEQIANQVEPVGQVIEGYVRPNGLRITRMRVPLGVVLFFYESRPNVTSDAAALCLKSGNAIILRGGKEAFWSNQAIVAIIKEALRSAGINEHVVQFIETTDRALVPLILKQEKHIDLVIPRGGESLIRAVVKESTIPVLKHYTGNCHIYIDSATQGLDELVTQVCVNAKTSYPGGAVCNAVEHLLFHKEAAGRLLPKVADALAKAGVEIRGDERTLTLYPSARPATTEDWGTEYLAFVIGIKVVDSLDEAVEHINRHGSHHTDAILTSDIRNAEQFTRDVDSGSVMVNASTRFADGGEYGLGAEIGISTDKLHARGPMGATDLTTTKWIVNGAGHCR